MDAPALPPDELKKLLDQVAFRLRVRHAVHGAVYGLWAGCGLGVLWMLVTRFLWFGFSPLWIAGGALLVGLVAGLTLGLARRCLDETGCALLVDRGLGTREQIVSALEASTGGVVDTGSALSFALVDRGRSLASELDPSQAVPIWRKRERRPLLFLPIGLAALPALFFIPPLSSTAFFHLPGMNEDVVEEAEQLQDRIEQIQEESEAELPEEIQSELEQLAEDLQQQKLTPEEAQEKLEEMQDQLEQFQEELADKSSADELQQAAEELADSKITEDLGEALQEPDLEKAAEEAEKMAQKAADATAAEQQAAADAMERAAQAMAESNPEMSQKMQEAAEAMQQMAENSQQGKESGSEMSQQQMQQLAQQLQQMEQDGLAEKLKEDEELMKMSQRLNGALESSS